MKKRNKILSCIIVTTFISASAFAQIGQSKTLVVYNDTGYSLQSTLTPNYNPIKFPAVIPKGETVLHYQHLSKPEFIHLEPIFHGNHILTNMFFNVSNDGIHGDITTRLSYRWTNLPWISLLTICTKAKASQCPFAV